MLLLMGVAAMIGGALWILIPALARAYLALDEILSTLMFNFIAGLLVNYLCTGPWRDPSGRVTSATARIPYEIPPLADDLHWGIVVAAGLALLLALWFALSRWGYEVKIAGANREAAVYAGIPVRRRLIEVMLLSGAIAGLAGMIEVSGTVHHLQEGISNNFGYFGIMVAVIAGGAPLTVIPVASLLAVILNAGIILQSYGMSSYEILALTGLVLFFVAIGERLVHFRVFFAPAVAR
jgi:simple sugar transport system permease protein